MGTLPNFTLIPDKIYKKMYSAVDWRKRDCNGKVVEKKIKYKLAQTEVENVARFIYAEITKDSNTAERWTISETEFYYFIAHVIHTKLTDSLRKYAG